MKRVRRILQLMVFAALTTTYLGCAETAKKESTGQYVDDSAITTKVKTAIFNDPTLKTMQINVKTNKGQVQLSGFVDSAENAKRAGEVARSVNGVTAVSNDLIVK